MIPYSRQWIEDDDVKAVTAVLCSDYLTQGPEVKSFEAALCEYTGAQYALVFNSATSALYAAYAAIGLGEGDTALTTPITFAATSNMLCMLGAKPKFVDVKPDGNMDEKLLETAWDDSVKAVIPVDYSGNPVAYDEINRFAKQRGVKVIADSSHALGSIYQGKKVGTLSDATILSFHAIKPITTGEGGALLCDDPKLFAKAEKIRSHGIEKKALWNSEMEAPGFNFRLSDIGAALGRNQLKKLDHFIQKRQEVVDYYQHRFQGHPLFRMLKVPDGCRSSWHLFPILLDAALWCPKEDIFQSLREQGLGVQVHYKPLHRYRYYQKLLGDVTLPRADEFYKSELSIPCHQAMTLQDAEKVADILLKTLEKYSRGSCG